MGESAGAMSLMAHTQSDIPLFRQMIVQSTPLIILNSPDIAQAGFDELLSEVGVDQSATDTEKLGALRDLTTEQIISLWADRSVKPFFDNGVVFQSPNEVIRPLCTWLKRCYIWIL